MLPHRRRKDQEFACEHAKGRHAEDRERAKHQTPPNRGADSDKSADIIDLLRTRSLRSVPCGEENGGLCEGVNCHVQQRSKIGDGPSQTECKCDYAHVLDR